MRHSKSSRSRASSRALAPSPDRMARNSSRTRSGAARSIRWASRRMAPAVAGSMRKPSCPASRTARASRAGSAANTPSPDARRTRCAKSPRPFSGSTMSSNLAGLSPCRCQESSGIPMALTVKSRRRRSSSKAPSYPAMSITNCDCGCDCDGGAPTPALSGSRKAMRATFQYGAGTSVPPRKSDTARPTARALPGTARSISWQGRPSRASRSAPPTRYAAPPSRPARKAASRDSRSAASAGQSSAFNIRIVRRRQTAARRPAYCAV